MDKKQFKEVRLGLNLTITGLAKLLDVSRQTIYHYENGRDIPKTVEMALHWIKVEPWFKSLATILRSCPPH